MNNPFLETLMRPVWLNTAYVFINEKKLEELISQIEHKKNKGELTIPSWSTPNVQPSPDCDLSLWINYVCWVNTVNFAFTNFKSPWNKFTVEYPKETFWSGSLALGASFMRAIKEGIPVFDAKYMSEISVKDISYIFRPISKDCAIPLLGERRRIFQETGRILLEKFKNRGNEWSDLFRQGDFRAFNHGKGIVELLISYFPSFWDVRYYKGRCLSFYKRAQLLVAMYDGRAANSRGRFPRIADIGDISPIADYEVPKALNFFGAMEYSSGLKKAIERREIIPRNSPWEIESRLVQSYIVWKICQEVGVSVPLVDFQIWNLGRLSSAPHILVYCTDY